MDLCARLAISTFFFMGCAVTGATGDTEVEGTTGMSSTNTASDEGVGTYGEEDGSSGGTGEGEASDDGATTSSSVLRCGDGACQPGETATTCPSDCACAEDEQVVDGQCVSCPAGQINSPGDDRGGPDTLCGPSTCVMEERVVAGECVACPPGTTNAPGDRVRGPDTTCDPRRCGEDEHVALHACTPCPMGTMNLAGDDASGPDTGCDGALCPSGTRVSSMECVDCPAGSRSEAGADPSGPDTSCEVTLCAASEFVVAHECTPCVAGTENDAGDDPTGGDTRCSPVRCDVDERVEDHACTACPAGTVNAPGDDASGPDSSCDGVRCASHEQVVDHTCSPCPPGSTNAAGDDPAAGDTTCDTVACGENERVLDHVCVGCAPGSTRAAGDDPSGPDTDCESTLCGVDERVAFHACTPCSPGSTNEAGDDATGSNTSCDTQACAEDEHVVDHVCEPCEPGSTNDAGDFPTGIDTLCDATLCDTNEHVVAHRCETCDPGTANEAGDNATGDDTECNGPCVPRYSRACDADGDVVWVDSCGEASTDVAEQCATANGGCVEGTCWCDPGLAGSQCDRCLIYVSAATGRDSDSGQSWDEAKATLSAGLGAAQDQGCEVWVAEGVYKPTDDASDRDATFALVSGVDVFGGFSGQEAGRAQRDFDAHVTTLSGDIHAFSSDSYHVVTGADDAILDGFTIRDGAATGVPTATRRGGGMYNVGVSPTVTNVVFTANEAYEGGAMFNLDAAPRLSGVVFLSNEARDAGGAVYNYRSSPRIDHARFEANDSRGDGGALFSTAAVFQQQALLLSDVLFLDNVATEHGGAIYSDGWVAVTVYNGIFTGNVADRNTGTVGRGGAIFNETSLGLAVYNSLFSGNEAWVGGGVNVVAPTAEFGHCTFVSNRAHLGGGVAVNATSSFDNSILWWNRDDEGRPQLLTVGFASEHVMAYSDIQGGCAQHPRLTCSDGNISANPMFSGTGVPRAGSPCIDAGDVTATPEDLADLDNDGVTSEFLPVDLDGRARLVGGDVDMGAFEHQGP